MTNISKEQQYIIDQKRFNAKVGDRVFVICRAKDGERGWGNGWVSGMDDYINKYHIVRNIWDDRTGIQLESMPGTRYKFRFPWFVLRIVR